MAEIYDFTKYQTAKEIEMYESKEQEKMCITCPECLGQEFAIYFDNTIQCGGCDSLISLEFQE